MNLNRVLDAFPDPWNPRFLVLLSGASVITAVVAALRAGSSATLPGLAALGAVLLAVFGRLKLNAVNGTRAQADSPVESSLQGYLLLGAGFAVAVVALASAWQSGIEWVAVVLPFLILALCHSCFRSTGWLPLVTLPLLFGLVFLDTAVLMGNPGAGGYPAVFAVFLVLVGQTTRRLEARFRGGEGTTNESLTHPVHRGTLAWLSTLFFLFGVITLWPWLGKLYSAAYLWILILGVLSPLLYLWGRMKQPGSDAPLPALARFNRMLPYIGLVLLVAILIG